MFTCESGFKPAAIRYVYLFMSMSAFAIFGRELTAFAIVLYCISILIAFSIGFFNQASIYTNYSFCLRGKHAIKCKKLKRYSIGLRNKVDFSLLNLIKIHKLAEIISKEVIKLPTEKQQQKGLSKHNACLWSFDVQIIYLFAPNVIETVQSK